MQSLEPQDSALMYASVLDALPIPAFLARTDGTISYVSRGWTEFLATDSRDIFGDNALSIVHPDQRARAVATWRAARQAQTPYRDELLLQFGDGTHHWVASQANPIRHAQTGRIVGWFGTLTDIDARKRAEETLRAQAEFTERLIDSSDDCIKILDLEARLISLSRNGQKTLRILDMDAVIGTSWIEFWQGEDRVAARSAIATALAGGTGKFTGYYPVKDEPRWFEVVVTAILDAAGRPEKLLAVSRDITLARRTTEALKESEQRYRAFGEALPGITWSASPQGKLDFVSEQWTQMRGRELSSAMGDAWLAGVHPDDRAAVAQRWHASISTGDPYDAQFRVAVADGTYRWQLVRALPARDEAGKIVRWIGVNVDIDEARRADDARDRFVALAENSSDFIAIGEPDGTIGYINGAGRRLLEIGSVDTARTTQLLEYFCPDDREFVRTEILPAVARDGRWVGDFAFRNFRTGAPVPVACNLFSLVDRTGAVTGFATVSHDRRQQARIEAGLRLLARTGAAALHSLDYTATLRNIAQAFVPDYAAYCIIDVITAQKIWQRTVVHRNATGEHIVGGLSEPSERHPVTRALELGESTLLTIDEHWAHSIGAEQDRVDAVAALDTRSFITVPVVMPNGQIVGGLTCARDGTDRIGNYENDDTAFVVEAGRRAGAAIANVRLYERERRIAVELQAASLPATLPRIDHLHLNAEYRPGSDEATIGGDWYDAFLLDDGRVAITVGDVLGHGLNAAVTMTKLRQAMQSAAMVNPDPNVMLRVADKTLRLLDVDGYATAIAAIYDRESHTLTFASAGHPGPVVRTHDGKVEAYSGYGLMLGLRGGDETSVTVVPMPGQSTVVFYTDGLVEATRDLEAGTARLHEALSRADVIYASAPARAIVEYVLGTGEASDDLAVLVAQIAPLSNAPAFHEHQVTYDAATDRPAGASDELAASSDNAAAGSTVESGTDGHRV